jgi:hypothetical protein
MFFVVVIMVLMTVILAEALFLVKEAFTPPTDLGFQIISSLFLIVWIGCAIILVPLLLSLV